MPCHGILPFACMKVLYELIKSLDRSYDELQIELITSFTKTALLSSSQARSKKGRGDFVYGLELLWEATQEDNTAVTFETMALATEAIADVLSGTIQPLQIILKSCVKNIIGKRSVSQTLKVRLL